ncbi:MAG: hypothetical protein JXA09_00050 [Anaerolineae bacterium]|nr:hypothetical protein [Anaerolineae bacterium]
MGGRRVCLQDLICLTGLCLLVLLFMAPALRSPDAMWYAPRATYSDLTVTHWPNMWFLAQSLRNHGQIPLWRPLIMGGAPYLGNPLSAMAYPPNWLFALFAVTPTFQLTIGLHLFAAGAAFYGLARWSYRCAPLAAFAGAVGYMLSPKLIAHLGAGHVGLLQGYAWLPLTVWLLRAAIARRSARLAAWSGAALALAYLADPRVAAYGAALLASYALYGIVLCWRRAGIRAALGSGLRVLALPAACASIVAVQMLPTMQLMGAISRADMTLSDAGGLSLPWRYLVGYLVADRGGDHEWMTYLGIAVLVLCPLALLRDRRRDRWFWAFVALLALSFALGLNAPLYPLLFRIVPQLSWLRVPPRALLLVVLAANLLAAFGADALARRPWRARVGGWVTVLSLAGLVLFAGLGAGLALLLGDELPAGVMGTALAGGAVMGALLLSARGEVGRIAGQALVLASLTLDLWAVDRSLVILRAEEEVFAEGAQVAATIAAQGGKQRVYSPSYSIPQHVGARYAIEQLDGVDPSQLRWVVRYMSMAGGYPLGSYGVTLPPFPDGAPVDSAWRDATPDAALLGLLGGRYVAAAYPIDAPALSLVAQFGQVYLYENARTLPRAFVVWRVQPVASWEAAQQALGAGYDPAGGALVVGGLPLDGPPGYGAATVTEWSPNRIVVRVEVDAPALLVLSEVWYPGWEVTVDGQPRVPYMVDGIVRGVYLDPGAHTVLWRYRPRSLIWGAAVTACGIAGLAVVEAGRDLHARSSSRARGVGAA